MSRIARPPTLRTISSSNRLRMPPSWRTEIAISENDSSVPIIQATAAGTLEVRTGCNGSGVPRASDSTGVTTIFLLLFGVGLVFRPRFVEGRQLPARGLRGGELRIIRHVDLEAARVEHLRHQADVGQRDMRAERVWARADQRFERVEA